ncbi:F-box/LRR-repeat protein 8-like [Physella acuta]|uniref:F-box/LRR-repeat protein 8-like n=1 Tax=Physella acuta TaxID=109671 RepID=UPI0027DCE639|nr:F-box/LRR-repeat protein 8-like [Physella acuta]
MATNFEGWANLPDPIIVHTLTYLSVADRCRAGQTCRHWHQCLATPLLWKEFNCGFFYPQHGKLLKCMEQYSHFITKLTIALNQKEIENRKHAISAVELIAGLDEIRLTHLTIQFKGENPYFYGGSEFIEALLHLLCMVGKQKGKYTLKYLNFSDLQVNFDNSFLSGIANNCPNLEYLNILNKSLVCNVSPEGVAYLVHQCRKLQVLHLYHTSLTDDVLKKLSEPGRGALQRLGVVCRRDEKYGEDISADAWSELVHTNPDLKVELGFDHTCPLHRVSEILKAEIPVEELHLSTFTRIYDEINIAVAYYANTLQKLVVHTRPSQELNDALLNVAQKCWKLHTLYVYCVVDKSVIERILESCPRMREKGTYILKWQKDPEPWTVGKEEGD